MKEAEVTAREAVEEDALSALEAVARLSPYIPRSPETSRWYWLRVWEFASMVNQ
ncbi:unnamed protein product [Lupinus luteus]|uniref:Uncharacterized protein n=1 Tax=Lupinus luteus TaxID=3873 RepID=A0AAV1YG56_LUPLU